MDVRLYMLLLGCKPKGRHTEQHDVFFGIGTSLADLVPDILDFWPEAEGRIHIDAWRVVTTLGNHAIHVQRRMGEHSEAAKKLFFLNLGGYKERDFEEYHYKCIVIAPDTAEAIRQAKAETFWKHSISSHIDDKYGIDVDDVYEIEDILAPRAKERYTLVIGEAVRGASDDELHPGYLKLSKITHEST